MNNNNKQLFTRMYGVAIVLILSVLSLAVQAQYRAEPTDFDRLLSAEFNAVSPPFVFNSNCHTDASFDCSGVLYLRLSPTLNIGGSTAAGGNQLVVRMEARAGQEAIGSLLVPAVAEVCLNSAGEEVVLGQIFCENSAINPGGRFIERSDAIPGAIDADNPANLLHSLLVPFTYSKEIFPGNPDNFTTVCTGATGYTSAQVSPIPPRNAISSRDNGVITYSYGSVSQGADPGTLTAAQRIQYPTDDYAELMTLTCNLPASASTQLLGMSYHLNAYGNLAFGHHVNGGFQGANSYATSPENSLEFFPLDGSNYIMHAEITEGGDGVLIEYAQAVTTLTGAAYAIATTSLDVITPTISEAIWLNNQTVWLTLGSSIYDAGVNNGGGTALNADRHVLVTSTFPGDTSFGTNFGKESTYRAVLTRHMSDADLEQTAPTIAAVTVAPGTESIVLTFSEAVCGAPETGCTALTADHFEVMHYGGVETEAPTLLPISFVDLAGSVANGYRLATLNIDLDSSPEIDGDDYLLVRTARNSRFTDNFITDRTIFSIDETVRTIPVTSSTYTEAESGMLHLQSGALVQAIPTIAYTLTDPEGNSGAFYSVDEGNIADGATTSTFSITRTPLAYNMPSATTVVITQTSVSNPDDFSITVGGASINLDEEVEVGFAPGEDEQTIVFTFTGNDVPNDDYIYEISIEPTAIPGSDSQEITFTIEDDDRDIDLLPIDSSAIAETAVENDGSGQQFIGIYSDATPTDIITEVGVSENTFRITQIVLNITGSNIVVMSDASPFIRTETGNEFTFSGGAAGVTVGAANSFLSSLEFGINSDEPTGGSDSLDVTLALTITAITAASEEADDTETAVRTINEENDPVELIGLEDGAEFTVQARALVGSGSLDIVTGTVNDGGDDSGITFGINPSTFSVPTAADSGAMETLTLSGNVTGEAFTLSISQSNAELAEANLMTTLTFSDGSGSIETRRITINIMARGLTLFNVVPVDFDRLLVGEMVLRGNPPTGSDCKAAPADTCSGVLYVRFGNVEINTGAGTGGAGQLVVRMEARAGQEAIGIPTTAATCVSAAGVDFPNANLNAGFCTFTAGAGAVFTPAIPGNIDADNPANILYNVEARFTYSKEIFPGNLDNFTTVCTGATGYTSAQVNPIPPRFNQTSVSNGVITYSYGSTFFNRLQDPGTLTAAQRIQYPADGYTELMTLTCNLPATASTQLLGMSYHLSAYRNLGHHVGANLADRYVTSPENSLEFFPLDGSNYIKHAEITEGGNGVLIEYAQAVTDNTGGTYQFTAVDGTAITLTSDAIWLNDRAVWLSLGSDIYAGVNVATAALDADHHVLVASTFPSDDSFGTNFSQTSTYRAVLTRHMSDADLARTAPRITGIEVADGTESIDLTFSSPVCGSPETGCAALTTDHFEVMHYEGDISETGAPTLLTIDSVTTSTDNMAANLDIDLAGSSVTIDSNDYLLVRTARNSRFTDNFITDRTIFSTDETVRTIPTTSSTYTEAASGMLHLQSGALARAIPTIRYALTNPDGNSRPYFADEGADAIGTTVTFTVTRSPTGYNVETTSLVTITNTGGGDPTGLELWFGGGHFSGDLTTISQIITFVAGEDEQTISFTFTGNDTSNDDHVYIINIAPTTIPPGSGSQEITFTIEDDERGINLLAIDDSAIAERAVENEGEQQFIGVYPAGTTAIDIITEVGVPPGTFTVTQIKLNITGTTDAAMVIPDDSSDFILAPSSGNEFTFSGGAAGVTVGVANSFLSSLEFGINSDEPTGGSDSLDVTLELTITDNEGSETIQTADRTINEENDPVELDGLADGAEFTVQARDLVSSSVIAFMATVNDGGDDSGISVEIDPATFILPTADDNNVTETLTLSGNVTGEAFTLSISQSNAELAATDVRTTLTFSDGRDSIETRTITIRIIVTDEIDPTIPNNSIVADPGATQVTLRFNSAYDTIGSLADLGNAVFTRDVDYVISITRLASGDKPMLTLPSITLSATDLGLPFAEGNSMPPSMQIEILLTRNDVVLAPSDAYRVTISVIDRADRFSSQSYEGDFTMLGHEDFPNTEDFRALLRSELAGVDCGTGSDSDGDGIANAYELSIGTDCNSDVNDYIGSVDPATAFPDVAITFLSPPDVLVVAAGASTYTQTVTDVTCEGADCNNLKAFIVSSGLTGDSDDAVAMVTGICPDPDDVSSVPNSCWVDDAFVDGNVRPIPLQLGYNLIDWVAADNNGNLILSTRQKQFIYVAPVVVLDGVTDLVLSGMAGTTGEGIFRARFLPQDGDQDGDPLSGNSISFIDGTVRTIGELPDEFDDNNASCTPPEDESGIDIIEVTLASDIDLPEDLEDLGVDDPQLVTSSGAGIYTYTAEVEYATSTSTVCRIAEVSTTSITFGDGSLNPFYLAGNEITVERGTVDEVASVRIEEIEIEIVDPNDPINFIDVAFVAFGETYEYEVEYSPTGARFLVKVASNDDEQFMLNDNGDGTGSFSIPSQTSMTYIALTATIMEGTSILNTHTVVYPIVDSGDPLASIAFVPDDDNDGVPDNLDDINNNPDNNDGDTILLSNRMPGATTFTTIEVPFGYRVSLGNIARRNKFTQAQLDQSSTQEEIIVGDIGTPPGYGDEGVFEFNVYLPEGTNTAYVSIPLLKALNEDKGYVKYINGSWENFDTTDGDAYYSAPGIVSGGVTTCPLPADPLLGITPQWGDQRNMLIEGHRCVLLVITDGGDNDGDGALNGIIVDPGAPGDDTGIVKGALKFRIKVFLEGAQ